MEHGENKNHCSDTFLLHVYDVIDCEIVVPDETLAEGKEYAVSFTYSIGQPPIQRWTLTWELPDTDGNVPTGRITPSMPNLKKNVNGRRVTVPPRENQTGTITGRVPMLPKGVDNHSYRGKIEATEEDS